MTDGELSDNSTSHFRKQKGFAATFRSVCETWKDYIDKSPDAHTFWITRANLGCPSLKGSFAIRLKRFYQIVSRSEGCDLMIGFNFRSDVGGPQDSEALVLLRSFIYGINSIIPYPIQIISLSFLSKNIQAC